MISKKKSNQITGKILFIVGPTAIGKTKIAIDIAKKVDGEIVSADSMQVYRGMDIGTAKPTKLEQKKAKHHLIDIYSPAKSISVVDYHKKAYRTIKDILKRKKVPIVVGGSGLYVRSLLQGLDVQPGADEKLRKQLEERAKQKGLSDLYAQLKKHNPKRAEQIKPTDKKRIIRALEIIKTKKKTKGKKPYQINSIAALGVAPLVFGLTCERANLYATIERRIDLMFRKGLVREAEKLFKKRVSKTAEQALGYKELKPVLKLKTGSKKVDNIELLNAKKLIKRNTRRFAKRQLTWFKKERGIRWISMKSGESFRKITLQMLSYL